MTARASPWFRAHPLRVCLLLLLISTRAPAQSSRATVSKQSIVFPVRNQEQTVPNRCYTRLWAEAMAQTRVAA